MVGVGVMVLVEDWVAVGVVEGVMVGVMLTVEVGVNVGDGVIDSTARREGLASVVGGKLLQPTKPNPTKRINIRIG